MALGSDPLEEARNGSEGTSRGSLGRALSMSSILERNLNLSFTTPRGGQLRDGAAPAWTSSLVTWLGKRNLHLSGPPAEELIYAPNASALPVCYRECGLALQAELGGGGEVPLRATQWLKPGSTDQTRPVCKILSFRCEEDGARAMLLTWERRGNHALQVGDVIRAHERGAGSDYSVSVPPLPTTSQQLVHLTNDWHSGEHRTVTAILNKQVTPKLSSPPSALTPVVDLLAGAETVYTDGSYKVVGTLLQRICGTALHQASASIVAKRYDGSYKALCLDFTGRVGSAATAELVGATVTGAAGMEHKDQVAVSPSMRSRSE